MQKNRNWLVVACWVIGAFAWSVTSGVAWADENDDIRADLEKAQSEIQLLREELNQLKENSQWQYQQQLQQAVSELPPVSKDGGGGTFLLPTGWTIQPYGYFKFDMSYDDSAVNGDNGDYIVSVQSENDQNRADDRFSYTARQTRLGMKVFAPDFGDLKVMGRVEIDFYNPETSATNEYKAVPMLRHAYGQVTGTDWSFLFGQTSDIISPLNPDTLNYSVGWVGGNVGYRHPQLRFSKWWQGADEGKLKVETALSRDIGSNMDIFGVDDGQDSSAPTILGRVSYSLPSNGKRLEAGVSGHWGKEEVDWDNAGDDDQYHTWSVNADLLVPICETVEFKGEFFLAENFNSYLGGAGAGIVRDPVTGHSDEVQTVGGWLQLAYKPCTNWAFHGGAGMDNPLDEDLNNGGIEENCFVFGNAIYNFTSYLSTGFEVTYWNTNYKNIDDGDDFRLQHSWILKF